MACARVVLLVLCGVRVSLAADWEFEDSRFTSTSGDAIDYKDPCKAGTVPFTFTTLFFVYNT